MRLLFPKAKKFWSPSIIIPAGAGLSQTLTLTFTQSGGGSASTNTCTWTNFSIGSAGSFATRRVIVAISCINGIANNLTSATIGGVAATIHVNQRPGALAAIISADVPTGSTATIVATFGGTIFATPACAVYVVDDALLISTTPSTGFGSGSAATSMTTSSYTQTAGGFAIASAALNGGGSTAFAVTGFNTDFGGGTGANISSSLTTIGSTGSVTTSATWATSNSGVIVAAAWR